jgi:hypothetical protein
MNIFEFKTSSMACRQSKSANCKLEQKYRSQRVPKNPKPNAPSDIFKRIDVSCCSSPCHDDSPNHVTPVPIIKNAMTEVIRCARGSPYVVSQEVARDTCSGSDGI